MNLAFRQQVNAERALFKLDVLSLFKGYKHGHMGHWEYSDPLFDGDLVQGSQEWQRFLNDHPEYYIIAQEIELARLFAQAAGNYQDIETIVDFGPGATVALRDKSFEVIKHLLNASRYVPIDHSQDYLSLACEFARKKGLHCDAREGDFFTDLPFMSGDEPTLFMMWGGTHSNIQGDPRGTVPFHDMVKQLGNLRRMMKPNDRLIISQDANQNRLSVERAYTGQEQFARTILHRIERDLNPQGDFDKDAFKFGVKWFQKSCALAHFFTIKRDMYFTIDSEVVTLKKGQKLYFNNSYKFPENGFKAMLDGAGFKQIDTPLYESSGNIALHKLTPA